MKPSENTPWLLVSGDLRKDVPYFSSLGFLAAVLQFVSYDYFNKADWAVSCCWSMLPSIP